MKRYLKIAGYALVGILYVSLGWIVGLALIAVWTVRLLRFLVRARRALAPHASCPWCRQDVAQYGAFGCGNCHARSLGWAWRCRLCGAWSGHVECPHCGLSVTNPILGAP